jgi:hypothetical protein
MKLQFRPGYCEEETILEITVPAEVLEATYEKMVRQISVGGGAGDYGEGWAYADLPGGPAALDLDEGVIKFIFQNAPEGEDALDPAHPDWTRARDTLWIEALPRVREFLSMGVL